MKVKRGAFIVLEGCDRVGKSTQVKKIVEVLNKKNIRAVSYAFPNRSTEIGKQINSFLKTKTNITNKEDKENLHLLFSQNRRELEPEMRKLLSEGITLIVDRYSFSGVAFSAANELDVNWCWEQEKGLLKPDLVLLLSLSLEKAALRAGYGNEVYENLEFQEKVMTEFENMMSTDSTWELVDVDCKDINTINKELLNHILDTISKVRNKNLSKFS